MAEICSQIIQDFCEITSYERCKLQYWGGEARVKQHIETSSKITTYVWRTYAKWSHRKTHSGRAFSTVAKELLGDLCKAFASMTIHEAQKKGARYCR